jgi:hypothetical protein
MTLDNINKIIQESVDIQTQINNLTENKREKLKELDSFKSKIQCFTSRKFNDDHETSIEDGYHEESSPTQVKINWEDGYAYIEADNLKSGHAYDRAYLKVYFSNITEG